VHNRTDGRRKTTQNGYAVPDCSGRLHFMMLLIGIGAALIITTIVVTKLRALRAPATPNLGWMSEQWLAEHRAMHPS
jgi:hypothetical protein